jgi:hypothetical protein
VASFDVEPNGEFAQLGIGESSHNSEWIPPEPEFVGSLESVPGRR